ncbi:MAG: DUF2207 domain-containing protein [Nitrospirae bacterium]|nr:DUF2207 domain-containing protein [Nitrospirota bacterium]
MKMAMKRALYLAVLLLLLMATSTSAALYLSSYEAEFEVVKNRSGKFDDVQATLRIAYKTDQPLSSGFKFAGSGNISNVLVSDIDGGLVNFTVEKLKENKISFEFPAITSGSKTFVITFLMEDAINDRLIYSLFDSKWVGKWQIPVNNAVYTFILPQGFTYSFIDTNFASFNKTTVNDKQAVQIFQPLLSETAFSVKIKPSLGGHSVTFLIVALTAAVLVIMFTIINIKRLPEPVRLDTRELTPSEAGYLKKGLKHSICVCVFDLLQLGHLIKTPPNELQSLKPDDTLYAYETVLMSFFMTPCTLNGLFRNKDQLKYYESEMVSSLTRKGCLKDVKSERAAAGRILWASKIAAVAVVAAWIYADVSSFFLIVSLLAPAIGAVAAVVLLSRKPKSGRAKYALEKLEKTVGNQSSFVRAGNPMISYAVAILGLGILAGTVFDEYLGYVSSSQASGAGDTGSSTGCSGCSTDSSSSDSGGDSGGSSGCSSCGGGGGD